jgi:UDP-glucose 4-epimerase
VLSVLVNKASEEMFADIAAAGKLWVLSLRYFNPVGSDPLLRTGLQLKRPSHALGKLIQAHQEGTPFPVTGVNYPTRDGTGIRDYVHVWDLATAHIAAIDLGTGSGTTVRELCTAFNNVASTPRPARPPAPGPRPPCRLRPRRLRPGRSLGSLAFVTSFRPPGCVPDG